MDPFTSRYYAPVWVLARLLRLNDMNCVGQCCNSPLEELHVRKVRGRCRAAGTEARRRPRIALEVAAHVFAVAAASDVFGVPVVPRREVDVGVLQALQAAGAVPRHRWAPIGIWRCARWCARCLGHSVGMPARNENT